MRLLRIRNKEKRGVNGMESEKEKLYKRLNEIQELIDRNENEDGTYRFDVLRAQVALEFARAEIEKSAEKYGAE